MATLNEIAYDILQHLRANNVDDDDIDLRSIRYWVKNQRALWIKNELSTNKEISQTYIQDLGIYTLEDINDMKKTTVDVPTFLYLKGEPLVVQVIDSEELTTDIAAHNYPFICYAASKTAHSGRFNAGVISSFLYEDRVYVVGNDLTSVEYVRIRGILVDPTDATGFTNDDDYPIGDELLPYLKAEILKLDGRFILDVEQDINNDSHNELN